MPGFRSALPYGSDRRARIARQLRRGFEPRSRLALERAGFRVIAAADSGSALTHAVRERPDLVVLDIGLPELDGLEVCRRIRQRSEVPVLFLTARDDETDRVPGLELGADAYVAKPFSPRKLVARMRAILKRTAGRRRRRFRLARWCWSPPPAPAGWRGGICR